MLPSTGNSNVASTRLWLARICSTSVEPARGIPSTKIGVSPDGQSRTVASNTPLRAVERGELEDHVVVRELTARLADVAERARERMDRLGELDAASQDVVIEVVRALEQQLWMIRAQFPDARKA